jgi:hypothetical protein
MPLLGRIVRLQVQESSLKMGDAPRRWYDPSPILAVPKLRLSPDGVAGVLEDDAEVVDVHNRRHPASKNRGDNGVSIGFVSHYDAMRGRFGEHMVDGISGENILVEIDRMVDAREMATGLKIRTSGGEEINLSEVIVAAPCVEFSRFALQFPRDARPDRSVTEAVQFLHEGMRGFYARYEGPGAVLSVGDEVLLA